MVGMPVKDIFAQDEFGLAGVGKFLYGWSREAFECIDETLRTHTIERKNQELAKDYRDQDPYFGAKPLSDVLLRTSNEVRHVSEFLSFDEEIISQLGKLPGMSYCPDKKNKRGVKVFSMNGCNHMHLDDKAIKGYYFWWHLYRGKLRHQPTPFAAFGLGFDVVCRAVVFLGLQ